MRHTGHHIVSKVRGILCVPILASCLAVAVPVGRVDAAPTAQQNFITKVYNDFLFGDPSDDQMLWWDTYLNNGNSRTGMVAAVLNSTDFKLFWTIGVYDHYLGQADLESPDFQTIDSDLNSSGNFLAAEVTVLSSAAYFSAHGSTNSGWVTGIYQNALQRNPDPSGLSYWVNRLDNGASTRAQAAATILRSNESATRRVTGAAGATACATTDLTDDAGIGAGSYCIVLDRMADASGASYWTTQLTGSSQLPSLWTSLAASTEYSTTPSPKCRTTRCTWPGLRPEKSNERHP